MLPQRFFSKIALVLLLFFHCLDQSLVAGEPAVRKGLYDTDPKHLWNRLHETLFVRTGPDGKRYGFDQLDSLLWHHTKHLREGKSHDEAIKVLDEFLAHDGEKLIRDPLKRTILQRELWRIFDWTTERDPMDARDLQERLAAVIRKIALTKAEIEQLPDNYAAAVQSREFASEPGQPMVPFLPPDLFSTNGDWLCLKMTSGEAMAPAHTVEFGARSAFLIFTRMPGGRAEAIKYFKELRETPEFWSYKIDPTWNRTVAVLNPNVPQFADGTIFVLLRQAMLVAEDGTLVPTHLTESVQIRQYYDVARNKRPSQNLVEIDLSMEKLFAGKSGGLRAVGDGEEVFRQFMDDGRDPFERASQRSEPLSSWMHGALDCFKCHRGAGLFSLNIVESERGRSVNPPEFWPSDAQQERDASRYQKETRYDWGLLQGLWRK